MPGVDILTGVSQINISQLNPGTSVGSMAASSPTVSIVAADTINLNSPHSPLVPGEDYKVTAALVGYDPSRKGYTIGIASQLNAVAVNTVTAKDAIHFHVDLANLPLGAVGAVAAMFFLKVGAADPQACGFGYVNPAMDLDYFISSKPISRAPTFKIADLTAATASKTLGSRTAEQVSWLPFTPTTGGVRLVHKTSQITVRPDDAPDFNVVTTRATDLQFAVLSGDNESIIQAIGGNFTQVTVGGYTYQVTESDIVTAMAQIQGNRAIQVYMPIGSDGHSTIRTYLGNLTANQTDTTELTSKTEQYQIDFHLQAAALDYLTRNLHSTIWHTKFAA